MDGNMEPNNVREQIHRDFLKDHDRPWKSYTLDLVFPPLHHSDKSPLPCRETPEELEAATRQFSAGIRDLFKDLESLQFYIDWHKRRTKGHKPLIHPDGLDLTIRIHGQHITVPYDEQPLSCLHRVYHSRRLRLLPADLADLAALPRLHWITKLTIEPAIEYDDEAMTHFAGARPISPLAPLQLAARLPALRELRCPWLWEALPRRLRAARRAGHGPWRDSRHELGDVAVGGEEEGLVGGLPATLRTARLWFWRADGGLPDDDQVARMPDLVRPAAVDPVSVGLRALAARLEVLDLRAMTQWSGSMKRLRVEFHPCRPDGSWYFAGPRGEDPNPEGFEVGDEHYPPAFKTKEDEEVDEDYYDDVSGFGEGYEHDARKHDLFRVEPVTEKVEPLLAAFGEALRGMASLEGAELFAWLTWQPSDAQEYGSDDLHDDHRRSWKWGVRYVPAKDGTKGRVEWQVGDWRPRDDIIILFESLGGDSEIEVIWKPFDKKDGRETWKDDELW
ncbi:hypothetical protein SLS63_013004 [Diaporthe eres]|uniref:F-box domain-containing protein n=1 Tax=Diaporthe eres TaxID=83184 RepID=A0ABR1NPQ3_DIAER